MGNESAGGQTRSSSAAETTAAAQRAKLKTLRRPVSKLTVQVEGYLSESATALLKRAGDAASEMMSGVRAKSREAWKASGRSRIISPELSMPRWRSGPTQHLLCRLL